MADTIGQNDIRGINLQKFVTGFADEDIVLKSFCRVSSTDRSEIRWFQKTAGYVSPATTTAVTGNLGANTAVGAVGPVAYQSWTRNTSYVREYKLFSETITERDEKDTDLDVLMVMVRDLMIGVASQVDVRIYNVGTESLSPSNILSGAATADGWDDAATGDPILDILKAKQAIRAQRYDPNTGILYINSIEEKNLLQYLISVKGSSIPGTASAIVEGKLRLMEILNLKVVVSENATTDYAWVFIPQKTVAWKQFTELTSWVVPDPSIGKQIRIKEEGEALLEHPKSSYLITDTVV